MNISIAKRTKRVAAILLTAAMISGPATPAFAAGQYKYDAAKTSQSQGESTEQISYVPDQLLVTFSGKTSNSAIESTVNKADADVSDITKMPDGKKAALITTDNDMSETADTLNSKKSVVKVQPNYIYKINSDETKDPYMDPSNAPEYQYQIPMVKAEEAWNELESKGIKNRTVVAVLDTGIDTGHEDLKRNVILNNGFYHSTARGEESELSGDSGEHGTHVSGIIGAEYGNGKGGTGVASGHENELVSILPVGISSDGETMTSAAIIDGINYAVNNKARVINMSFGSSGKDEAVAEVVKSAYDNGVVLVGASGNSASDSFDNPNSYKQVISVNACNSKGAAAYYSDYGTYKDITAPGTQVYSTVPGSKYEAMSGTSMASPVVAGCAALVLDADPDLTPAQVYNILCSTTGSDEFTDEKAYGIVNAEEAVKAALNADKDTAPESITMKETKLELTEGESYQGLEVLVRPSECLADISWKSSDPDVVSVDSDGDLKALKAGKAVITASCGDKSVSCEISVAEGTRAESIEIKTHKTNNIVGVGDTINMDARALPADSTDKTLIFSSSDNDILECSSLITESEDGRFVCDYIARKPGKVLVTASTPDGRIMASQEVTVKYKPYKVSVISPKSKIKTKIGKTLTIKAKITDPKNGTDIDDNSLKWTVSRPSRAQTLSKSYDPESCVYTIKLKCLKAGKLTVKAEAYNGLSTSKVITISAPKAKKKTSTKSNSSKNSSKKSSKKTAAKSTKTTKPLASRLNSYHARLIRKKRKISLLINNMRVTSGYSVRMTKDQAEAARQQLLEMIAEDYSLLDPDDYAPEVYKEIKKEYLAVQKCVNNIDDLYTLTLVAMSENNPDTAAFFKHYDMMEALIDLTTSETGRKFKASSIRKSFTKQYDKLEKDLSAGDYNTYYKEELHKALKSAKSKISKVKDARTACAAYNELGILSELGVIPDTIIYYDDSDNDVDVEAVSPIITDGMLHEPDEIETNSLDSLVVNNIELNNLRDHETKKLKKCVDFLTKNAKKMGYKGNTKSLAKKIKTSSEEYVKKSKKYSSAQGIVYGAQREMIHLFSLTGLKLGRDFHSCNKADVTRLQDKIDEYNRSIDTSKYTKENMKKLNKLYDTATAQAQNIFYSFQVSDAPYNNYVKAVKKIKTKSSSKASKKSTNKK